MRLTVFDAEEAGGKLSTYPWSSVGYNKDLVALLMQKARIRIRLLGLVRR